MATSYTSLLGLALPVQGELSGTWGDVVNNSITSLVDSAVAGTTTLSTDADVTLTTTTGAANTAREAILLCTGARTALRNITAPAQSKTYTVINATTGGFAVVIRGVGPTTGISVPAGFTAQVAWNGSDFVTGAVGAISATSITDSGNLNFTGTGNRITGDFSNATIANRVLFQTSTANTSTIVQTIPSGTGTVARWNLANSSDPANASEASFAATSTEVRVESTLRGTGTYLPMTFYTGGSERVRVDTSGNVGINTIPKAWAAASRAVQVNASGVFGAVGGTDVSMSANAYFDGINWKRINANAAWNLGAESTSGAPSFALRYAATGVADSNITWTTPLSVDSSGNVTVSTAALLGYGTGSGGTVTQATSKATSVALNKPTGQITMNNAALAAGTTVAFQCANNLVGQRDLVIANIAWGTIDPTNYSIRASAYITAAGTILFQLKNESAVSLSEAVIINFAVIKGSIT